MTQEQRITIAKPDDWHLHIRTGKQMKSVLGFTAQQFGRAIIMPNLKPPVATVAQAFAYQREILNAVKEQSLPFKPLMTLYLTDNTTAKEIRTAKASGIIHGCKLYPAGATTNSDEGVTSIEKIYPILAVMEEVDMPLLVHGEVTDPKVDIFDREKEFIDRILWRLAMDDFPNLRIVLEHITTKDGVGFVDSCGDNVAATITAHHLLCNRNHLLVGGIKPHHYCLPILKTESDRLRLLKAALSGNPKFFLGTDSAPHAQSMKENACGCAGCFTAPHALALYAKAFEEHAALFDIENWVKQLEKFASFNGADFYKLPRNTETVTLVREDWTIPNEYPFGQHPEYPIKSHPQPNDTNYTIIPFYASNTLPWQLETVN